MGSDTTSNFSYGLVQVGRCSGDDQVEGADGLAGGFYPQTVCQVEGLDGIIKCRGAIIGGTRGMGQGTRVNSGDWAILIMDVGGKFGILGMLVMSTCLLAAMMVAATLSLGRNISTATAIGSTLLLLIGELWVCLLVLHSAKLVGLRGLATSTPRGTLLFKREHCCLHNSIGFQGLDLARRGLAAYLSYDLHGGRELAKDNHCLHIGRELKAGILEICKVAQHFSDHGSSV